MVLRSQSIWSGFVGAPGYTNLYFQDEADLSEVVAATRAFFAQVSGYFPNTVTVRVPGGGDTFGTTSGELDGSWDGGTDQEYVGQQTGNYSAATGAVVGWRTSTIRAGRRMQGRTFLVPLGGAAFDGSGSIGQAVLLDIRDAANDLVASTAGLVVWGRPTAPGATDGVAGRVTAARVPDLAAVLRSRRD